MELLYNLDRGDKHHKLLPKKQSRVRELGSAKPEGREREKSNVILHRKSEKAFLLRYLSIYLMQVNEGMSHVAIWGKGWIGRKNKRCEGQETGMV